MNLDLIFSIGPACRPAYHLKQHFLRFFSCPLDYQMDYSLDTVLHLFQTSFTDFFTEIEEDALQKGAHNNRRIIDTKNSIISLHHFDSAIPLPDAQKHFQTMMRKRFDLLHHAILHSDTVGLMCNRTDSIQTLSAFLKSFAILYPEQNFILLNIRHNDFLSSIQKQEYRITDKLTILDYECYDLHPHDETYESEFWIGNSTVWDNILNEYRITNHPFINQIQQWNKEDKKILLYGAGEYCKKILCFLKKYQIDPYGIAVSDTAGNPDTLHGIAVKPITSYFNLKHHSVIIITVINPDISADIKQHLIELGFDSIATTNACLKLFYCQT